MTSSAAASHSGLPMHWKMSIGFLGGLLIGLAAHYWVGADVVWVQHATHYLTTPFSKLFLNLIFMLIVPLMFSALVVGVAEMGTSAHSVASVGVPWVIPLCSHPWLC